jgi:DNA-binding transcriptional LysR family regulator
MDAADLRTFEAVARLGAMNRAAAELHTVQSNVTARIRSLEEELKIPLFERHSSGVSLTDAGRRLLPYAIQMHRLIEDAHRAVAEDGTPKGGLVIGSLETTAALRLSPLLAAYVAAYPEVDLVLRTGTSAELVQEVLARRLEGAFVCGPIDHPDLEWQPVVREELVVLTARAVTNLDEILTKPDLKLIVLRAGCSYRQRLEEILARRGVVGLRWLEFGTIESIVSCVAAGLGVTLLPKALIGAVWRDGRVAVHALPSAESAVETLFIRRRDGFVSSALAAFLMRVRTAVSRSEAAE